jgi:hypothetical protein
MLLTEAKLFWRQNVILLNKKNSVCGLQLILEVCLRYIKGQWTCDYQGQMVVVRVLEWE